MCDEKLTDEELMLRVKYGDDRPAYEELYRRRSGRSLAICRRSCPPEADDLNQKAWVRVWFRRRTFRDEAKFIGWLIVITTSVCREGNRKEQGRKEIPVGDCEGGTAEDLLDRLALRAEQLRRDASGASQIHRAWARLSAEERWLLQRRYILKELVKDVALELKVSEPTVRERTKSARATFLRYLKEEGIGVAMRAPTKGAGKEQPSKQARRGD